MKYKYGYSVSKNRYVIKRKFLFWYYCFYSTLIKSNYELKKLELNL